MDSIDINISTPVFIKPKTLGGALKSFRNKWVARPITRHSKQEMEHEFYDIRHYYLMRMRDDWKYVDYSDLTLSFDDNNLKINIRPSLIWNFKGVVRKSLNILNENQCQSF